MDNLDVREEFQCGPHELRLAVTTGQAYLVVWNGPGEPHACEECRQAWNDARDAADVNRPERDA